MIDHHVHIGTDSVTGFSLTLEELLEKMDLFDIDKSVVFPCPNMKINTNPYREENERICLSCKNNPKIVPFMFVHPFLDEIGYLKDLSPEFEGFKLYSRGRGIEYYYSDLYGSKLLDFLISTKKPLLFHTGYRDRTRIKYLAKLVKETKSPIVFAHAGDLIERDLVEVAQYENSFIDVSPIATMLKLNFFTNEKNRSAELRELTTSRILSYVEKLFGKKRVVWGSDSPWSDNLISEGYKKEVGIGKLMYMKGFDNSYLEYEKPAH